MATHDSIQFIDFTIVDMAEHLLSLNRVNSGETVSKLGHSAPFGEGVILEELKVLCSSYFHGLVAGVVGAD